MTDKHKDAAAAAAEEEEGGLDERPDIQLTGELSFGGLGGPMLLTGARMRLTIGDTLIMEDARLTLMRGRRYGFIGPNGEGKTTLLNALRAELEKNECASVRYVGQTDGERLAKCSDTLVQHVMLGDENRAQLAREVAALEAKESLTEEEAERLGEAMAELDLDDPKEEKAVQTLLQKLGFRDVERQVSVLSGGWRSRLEVASALWSDAEVLLLDEPTNHMDLEAILQLAGLLCEPCRRSGRARTVVVVSHDAAFLDMVCTDTVCLFRGQLTQCAGPYRDFEEQARQFKQFHTTLYDAAQRRQAQMKQSIQAQRERAARTQNSAMQKNAASREKNIDRAAMYREDGKRFKTHSLKFLDAAWVRLPARAMPVVESRVPSMRLPPWCEAVGGGVGAAGARMPLLQANTMVIGPRWGPNGGPLFTMPALNVSAGDRIAVVGCNGCGKTTLLRILSSGATNPKIPVRCNVQIAVVGQNQLAALDGDMDQTPMQWIIPRLGERAGNRPEEEARKMLKCFAIGQEACDTPIAELSGGLRVRLLLAGIFTKQPQIIFLDEPTNHLDGESITALVELCRVYPGAIVGVSHNVAFLLQTFTELWLIRDGKMTIRKTATPAEFADAFKEYAMPFVGSAHRDAFEDMLRVRAARSTLIAPQAATSASLMVG